MGGEILFRFYGVERRYNKERAASSEAASNEGIRMARQSGGGFGGSTAPSQREEEEEEERRRGKEGQDLLDPLVAANFARDVRLLENIKAI